MAKVWLWGSTGGKNVRKGLRALAHGRGFGKELLKRKPGALKGRKNHWHLGEAA